MPHSLLYGSLFVGMLQAPDHGVHVDMQLLQQLAHELQMAAWQPAGNEGEEDEEQEGQKEGS